MRKVMLALILMLPLLLMSYQVKNGDVSGQT